MSAINVLVNNDVQALPRQRTLHGAAKGHRIDCLSVRPVPKIRGCDSRMKNAESGD
jgi:hypothetical protein